MNERSKAHEVTPGAVPARRPYKGPRLERYGTLSDVTQATGNKNNATADGGPPNMDKTS